MPTYIFIISSIIILLIITHFNIKKIVETEIIITLLRFLFLLGLISYIVYFIYSKITNTKDKLNYFTLQFNTLTIGFIILFFFICFVNEYINSNSSFLITIIKPFSDFFGYIVIEKYINDIFRDYRVGGQIAVKPVSVGHDNETYRIKIYNNWYSEINKIKRRLNLEELNSSILKNKDNLSIMLDKLDDTRGFINSLNIKEDIGYIIWIIIVIILLDNI